MKFINNLLGKLFGPSDEEMDKYYHRFIEPHRERLRAAGATEVEIDMLWNIVLKNANPTVVGQAPGALLAAMADRAEAGEPIAHIIDTSDLR